MALSVAICSVGEVFGGVERHILGLLAGLRSQGILAHLILFDDDELAIQARRHGFEVLVLTGRNRSILTISRKVGQILRDHEVQVVHTHGYKATVYCAFARLWYRFAMIKTAHGMSEHTAGRPMQNLRGHFYQLLDTIATRFAVDFVCCVTGELRIHHTKLYSKERTAVIANGISDIDRSTLPRPAEFDATRFNVTVVGRLDTVKGHRFAIDAVAVKGMPSNLHLHLIGTGPCEAELRSQAKNRGIANRVHFLGFRRNIYDYLAHCDLLLMPSLHEGLPYTLLEAMALGAPVIASRVGGLAEVLRDDMTALLVPPCDVDALANAIVRLMRDRPLRLRLGEHAKQLQQAEYSLDAMTNKYVAAYRDLAATPA